MNTGLKDSYGTPIKDGDTIEWTYYETGFFDPDGNFVPGMTSEMVKRKLKSTQLIKYEVREHSAGYFLSPPNGFNEFGSLTGMFADPPTCKVI